MYTCITISHCNFYELKPRHCDKNYRTSSHPTGTFKTYERTREDVPLSESMNGKFGQLCGGHEGSTALYEGLCHPVGAVRAPFWTLLQGSSMLVLSLHSCSHKQVVAWCPSMIRPKLSLRMCHPRRGVEHSLHAKEDKEVVLLWQYGSRTKVEIYAIRAIAASSQSEWFGLKCPGKTFVNIYERLTSSSPIEHWSADGRVPGVAKPRSAFRSCFESLKSFRTPYSETGDQWHRSFLGCSDPLFAGLFWNWSSDGSASSEDKPNLVLLSTSNASQSRQLPDLRI